MIALVVIATLLCFAAGWAVCNDLKDRRAEREAKRAKRAEDACEELRVAPMKGSAVATWSWPNAIQPTAADPFYFHVRTTRGDLLLTEEALAVALDRATNLLPSKNDRKA